MKLEDLPEIMNVEHVQEYLQIGRVQAYELVNLLESEGKLRVLHIGKRRKKIVKDSFVRWIEGK